MHNTCRRDSAQCAGKKVACPDGCGEVVARGLLSAHHEVGNVSLLCFLTETARFAHGPAFHVETRLLGACGLEADCNMTNTWKPVGLRRVVIS